MGIRQWLAATSPIPARKTPTGTSYQAQGLTPAPQQHVNEEGSGRTPVLREIVPDLASPFTRQQTYAKMMNDSGVDVSMRIYKTPILGADFYVDPYDDQPVNQEIAEFVWANLNGGMNSPFTNSLEDILHFFEDGYSVLEKVYELREWTPKGANRNTREYTMLKKLGVRAPNTIKDIQYDDNGGPKTLVQNAIQADGSIKEVDLDIAKLLIFVFNKKGGDITGKSLLRTAHENWYYKKHFYKIDAIQKERHALGIPKGKLLAGHTPKDKEMLRQMLRFLRTNEESFIIETPGIEVDLLALEGQLVNVLESAEHHNTQILMNVMASFMAMGLGGTSGNRATGATQSDIFMKALKFIAGGLIAETINMYLIPELVVYNYPTKSFPKLKVRSMGQMRDLQMFASAFANLLAQKGITSDRVTENWLRQLFEMPALSNDTQQAGEVETANPTTSSTASTNGKGATKQDTGGNKNKPANAPN